MNTIDSLLALAKANPLVAFLIAYTAVGAVASYVKSKAAPGSKLYHAMDLVLTFTVAVMQGVNAVLGILGKRPVGAPDSSRAITPVSGTPKTLIVVLALAAALWGASAHAADFNMGLSVPITRVRLLDPYGSGKPVVEGLSAGAGYTLGVGLLPASFAPSSFLGGAQGTTWDMLGFSGVAFLSFPTGGPQLGLGANVCTLSGLLCLGFGSDLLAYYNGQASGLLVAKVTRANLFSLLTVNLGLPFGDPVHSATGLPRGNFGLPLTGQQPQG